MDVALLKMDDSASSGAGARPDSTSPMIPDSNEIMRMLSDSASHMFANLENGPKSQLERILAASGFDDHGNAPSFGFDPISLGFPDISSFATLRNSSKTLKCPKCNWHYKYQETLEIHMKEKHSDTDVKCIYCFDNRQHPKLARGETYSCGYKPYRCDLCRYSTTTKGNLSIHMQSDKHLHAVQELPNSIANFACAAPVSRSSPIEESDLTYICLLCGIYASESLAEMVEHVEKDRSRPTHGDVSMVNGCFRCHLCPYNTTLKANFQLHTRTDKHLQKVQTANHLREGARPNTAIYRLASTKTAVQVLCRQCQEVISSPELLREHCHFATNPNSTTSSTTSIAKVFRCRICSTEFDSPTTASGHMTCHEPSTWPANDTIDFKIMDDAAYACAGCGFTTKDVADLEEHAKSHEDEAPSEGVSSSQDQPSKTCPLCMDSTSDLEKHLVEDHRIAESAIEKLLLVDRSAKESTSDSEYTHRCIKCSMAFRSETQLKTHMRKHVFSSYHKCPQCGDIFDDANSMLVHMMEHKKEECEMCSETFSTKEAFLMHQNSTRHLQQAKKHLESSMVDLNTHQIAAALQLSAAAAAANASSNDDDRRGYRCNICKQAYSQASSLENHMRAISHQNRMTRLPELIAIGEVDPEKQLFEQPGIPGPTIQHYLEQASKQMTMNDVMSLLIRNDSTEDNDSREEINGLQLLTHIKVYGETKITNLVAGLEEKLSSLASFDELKATEVSKIDCATCGQQIVGILALNLHYEEAHSSSIPNEVLKRFGEKLLSSIEDRFGGDGSGGDGEEDSTKNGSPRSVTSNDDEPLEKRMRLDAMMGGMDKSNSAASQLAMFSQMMNCFPFIPPTSGSNNFGLPQEMFNQLMSPAAQAAAAAAAANNSPAKRARTRITDDQLKVLRQYFNINSSPTEAQIKEMSIKAGLPEKVIKHWFRNTLFKERQRDKDSPYNFNIPPSMSIDLDAYEKTGETKVVSLSSEPMIKSEINSARATPVPSSSSSCLTAAIEAAVDKKPAAEIVSGIKRESSSASPQINIQAIMSQIQQANNMNFFDASSFMAAAAGPMAQMPQPCNTTSSGRRANRTRFTDFQLRTLQQFFDKQAYPKDDDLEALSKKLQLSPRVIVVWFQNARQKARKIYENQPNHENSDRFVRTPGSNFQCKRCSQVFQRYYELIQHQQKKCYKDDGAALANDNKSVEESLTDEEKAQLLQQQAAHQLNSLNIEKLQPNDILKLIGATQKCNSQNDVLLKMCESMGGSSSVPSTSSSSASFHKYCPFCHVAYREKSAMVEHLQTKHAQQMIMTSLDVDMLPDVDQYDMKESALDLSGSSVDLRESLSASPTRSDDDVMTEMLDDSSFPTFGVLNTNFTSGGNSGCRSPANNKRYRTHLTPLQVQIMKYIFNDYKTPTMAECEMLGKEIGLHKRVVQVWFQNARAKERKTRGMGEEDFKSMQTKCEQCDKQFSARLLLQDHLFSTEHISLLRTNLKKEGVSDVSTSQEPDRKIPKSASALDLSSFPFNFMNSMLPFVDVNLFGTPIPMLQIPEDVKTEIMNNIKNEKSNTVFTQDGLELEQLKQLVSDDEKENVEATRKDVGWACTACTNVFQEEKKLKEHQKKMCNECETMHTLTQVHYSCKLCSTPCCLQTEYIMHLNSLPHLQFKTTSSSP